MIICLNRDGSPLGRPLPVPGLLHGVALILVLFDKLSGCSLAFLGYILGRIWLDLFRLKMWSIFDFKYYCIVKREYFLNDNNGIYTVFLSRYWYATVIGSFICLYHAGQNGSSRPMSPHWQHNMCPKYSKALPNSGPQ